MLEDVDHGRVLALLHLDGVIMLASGVNQQRMSCLHTVRCLHEQTGCSDFGFTNEMYSCHDTLGITQSLNQKTTNIIKNKFSISYSINIL